MEVFCFFFFKKEALIFVHWTECWLGFMGFLKEIEPEHGLACPVVPGVRRIVARNPSPMTYHGTNTYLVDDDAGGLTVIDPGPDDAPHHDAVLAAGEGRIRRILVSHTHLDHVGGAARLREATGAPTFGWHSSASEAFRADHPLEDGASVAGLTALFTPGHAADHLCFEWRDGIVFTADHVMGWASSIVSPPKGDMRAYVDSLRLMLARPHRLYLCGHGPVVPDPHSHVRALLAHRIRRERAIAAAIARAPGDTDTLVSRLYARLDPILRRAAERTVLAHLLKLEAEGRMVREGEVWRSTRA
jgi:glyoxylase-like metal-dependent hydrolase (beta-lactamase superfamily II)